MALVSLTQAKTQLRIDQDTTEYDEDIELKMEQASAIVLDYLKLDNSHDWEAGEVGSPGGGSPMDDRQWFIVQCCVLEVLTNLFRFRGDDPSGDAGPITPRIESMLRRFRDPALA
jgi:hypothetical protein